MSELNKTLRRKAFGIMESIEKMHRGERESLPSEAFGQNYNRLLELVSKKNPDLVEILPPKATFGKYGLDGTNTLTSNNFSELHTFCSEIYYLLE